MTTEEIKSLDKYAEDLANGNTKLKNIYDSVKTISEGFNQLGVGYLHRNVTCILAAQVLLTDKSAIYMQLDTGNGKTYIMLLIIAYLEKEFDKKCIYVTLNSILKRQIDEKCQLLGIKFEVIMYD